MGIIVQKYGGNLVKDKESLLKVANNIIKSYNKGNKVVVVVSAQGNTTDNLTDKIKEITNSPIKREVDVILSSGEQVTIGLLSIILNDLGYPSVSFTGSQAGIYTDNNYTNANIVNINTKKLQDVLKENKIAIVAGFQGISDKSHITTLGRGGSDTTATFLAGFLNADSCEIYKDTQFIYTADPKFIKNAIKHYYLSYDQMFLLSHAGAKVLCDKCINFAKTKNVIIEIKSVETGLTGTIISDIDCNNNLKIIGITKKAINLKKDKITIVLNTNNINNEKAEYIIKTVLSNDIKYNLFKQNDIISFDIEKKKSYDIMNTLHNIFVKGWFKNHPF